jgi:predicted O-methyltransferase YrrM
VVELGTSTGESGTWFALALRKTGGHLYTHDIDPGRIKVARENYARAGVDPLITIIEGDAHETVGRHKDPGRSFTPGWRFPGAALKSSLR